jgi:protein-tyrosine phosphatase
VWWTRSTPSDDVLVVCTGNVCRSPYVAHRLRHELPALTVGSAGTGALVGRLPTPQVSLLLADRGVRDVETTAVALSRSRIRGARLVITAERRHRVEAVRLDPTAAARAFTLLELARILHKAGLPRGLGIDGVLAVASGSLNDDDDRIDHDDDLADPFGGSDDDYARMAQISDSAIDVILTSLRSAS